LVKLSGRLKHGRQRHVQCFADVKKARRAHTVDALFIFLNLLKRYAQFLPELGLGLIDKNEPSLPVHAGGPFISPHAALSQAVQWRARFQACPVF
jgi:hypothetical protein